MKEKQTRTSSKSIENDFNTAKHFQKENKNSEAIDLYLSIFDAFEISVKQNAVSRFDIYIIIFSLGNISEIYEEQKDLKKSLFYRNAQSGLLLILKEIKSNDKSYDYGNEIFNPKIHEHIDLTKYSDKFRDLLKAIQKAKEAPTRNEESLEEIKKKFIEAKKKEDEEKIENLVKQLEEASAKREMERKKSFFQRNKCFIQFLILTFVIGFVFISIILLKKHNNRIKGSEAAKRQLETLRNLMKEFEENLKF